MFKKIIEKLIITIVITIYPIHANAQVIEINDIILNSDKYNHKIISVQGEAIGEELKRGNYSWVNINDKSNSIGIYMENKDSKKIELYGGYDKIGDIIDVEGVYNKACLEHNGDTDIHAIDVGIVVEGIITEPNVSNKKIILAVVLIIISFLLNFILYRKYK